MTDWLGTSITVLIILIIILLVWSKVTGETPFEILSQLRDFLKGE